jgi:uncharacterized pyridoxamine 5'-phosphate oxidase family protein
MEEVVAFLKKCGVFYLATVDDKDEGQPRVRPFGALDVFEGKLYTQTGKVKSVAQQIAKNPKVEVCAFDGASGAWIRIEAKLVEDDRVEARRHMLEANPSLKNMYKEDDGNTEVLYFKDAVATLSSFGGEPKVIRF